MRAPSEIVRVHWPEYLMEAAGLGLFMLSAAVVTSLLEYPHSPLYHLPPDPVSRRVLTGMAMGLTAIGIIYSPWGKRSGAHLNPAVTVTFFRLGKIQGLDALFYVLAQFIGGLIGLLVAAMAIGMAIEYPTVNYVVTVPGLDGAWIAFAAEVAISFGLMLVVLIVSNKTKLNAWTGVFAGALVATYIAVEAPLSGMSMNPARTFGPDLAGGTFQHLWIYFVAPPLGMLAAAEIVARTKQRASIRCAKLYHDRGHCIFGCGAA